MNLNTDELSFEEALILSEEMSDGTVGEEDETFILVDERDKTVDGLHTLEGEDEVGDIISFPIEGEGELETFVIRANSPDFSVTIELDNNNIIDDDFTTIESFSSELEKISGFTDADGKEVVSASEYKFSERLNIVVRASGVSMDIIRAEVSKID